MTGSEAGSTISIPTTAAAAATTTTTTRVAATTTKTTYSLVLQARYSHSKWLSNDSQIQQNICFVFRIRKWSTGTLRD